MKQSIIRRSDHMEISEPTNPRKYRVENNSIVVQQTSLTDIFNYPQNITGFTIAVYCLQLANDTKHYWFYHSCPLFTIGK